MRRKESEKIEDLTFKTSFEILKSNLILPSPKKTCPQWKKIFRNLGASNQQPSTLQRDALTATPALLLYFVQYLDR